MKSFSDCLLKGWMAKKNIAQSITNSFLDDLYQYILDNGAESAKISGAGGGGFMMIFCNPCNRVNLVKALRKKEGNVIVTSFTEIGTQAWTIYNN
jgi:D-glycero-alpha-D-manno-heptose-7-phosphate kinase